MSNFYADQAKKASEEKEKETKKVADKLAGAQISESARTSFLAEHVIKEGETLSHVALKHYGHATPPYWKLIYEANKETIGASEKYVKVGMKLKIPALPADLEKK